MGIKVMIVDDQPLAREGLKAIMQFERDIDVICTAQNAKDAIRKIVNAEPDVVLMDIQMPVMDGVRGTRLIKRLFPKVKILILTTFAEDNYIIDALAYGAEGYILKDLPLDKLVASIKDAYNGEIVIQAEAAKKLANHLREHQKVSAKREKIGVNLASQRSQPSRSDTNMCFSLTHREQEIMQLLADGLSNTEIATALYITVGTVKNHMANIYEKTGISERLKLMLFALKNKHLFR